MTHRNVEPDTADSTDELMSYDLLDYDDYLHGVLKHSAKKYTRHDPRTGVVSYANHVESFLGLFRNSVASPRIQILPKRVRFYLGGFTFLSNYNQMVKEILYLLTGAVLL